VDPCDSVLVTPARSSDVKVKRSLSISMKLSICLWSEKKIGCESVITGVKNFNQADPGLSAAQKEETNEQEFSKTLTYLRHELNSSDVSSSPHAVQHLTGAAFRKWERH
jgi:hypothetical protein